MSMFLYQFIIYSLFEILVIKNLGSSPFIGKSSIFIGIQDYFQVIVDAGSHSDNQSKPNLENFNYQKYKFTPQQADALIISHAHVDHSGGLLNNNYDFHGKILMSQATKAIIVMNINQQNKQNKNDTQNEIQQRQFTEIGYFVPYKLNNYSDATVTLFPVPHIIGAAFILIQVNNRKILYTGDYNCLYPQFIQQNFNFYPELQNIDVLITETTFSSTVFQNYLQMQLNQYTDCLINILSKHQTVLTTSAQESINYLQIICHLADRLKLQNFITTSKKPFSVVEGSTKVYQQAITLSSEVADINGQRGIFYRDFFNSRNVGSQQLLVTTPKQINVASSLESLFQYGTDKNALFLLTGAVQPGSYNWRLINNGVQQIKRDNQKIYTDINAQFAQIGQIGHCDFTGLYRLIIQTQCKVVVGTHCAQIENLRQFEQMGHVFKCRVCTLVGIISLKLWKEEEINIVTVQKAQQRKLYRIQTNQSEEYIQSVLETLGIPLNQHIQITPDNVLIIYCSQTDINFICQQLNLTLQL